MEIKAEKVEDHLGKGYKSQHFSLIQVLNVNQSETSWHFSTFAKLKKKNFKNGIFQSFLLPLPSLLSFSWELCGGEVCCVPIIKSI